jgi:exopolyphosphatase/guanosine-5'-triphosphate,3'-diphosphate pyrophosphatase
MAVIDIGTSAVRLLIAQADKHGRFKTLESPYQAVSLGKDTFTTGSISMESTEACVKALRSFRRILLEYDISDEEKIRTVATSAVREAANKDSFIDRIYIATGLHVEPLDEAEGNRYTYMSVYPLLEKHPQLVNKDAVILEVGSGSTELLHVENRDVTYSHTYRVGSLRLREMLEKVYGSKSKLSRLMNTQIQREIDNIHRNLSVKTDTRLIALGGDARFAAALLNPAWDKASPILIDVTALEKLTQEMLALSVDEIAQRFHMMFIDAESVAPALLIYTRLAQAMNCRRIIVTGATLRDGILAEMSAQTSRISEFSRQIFHSAIELGRRYDFSEKHARHIADLCALLFQRMERELYLSSRYEIILRVAALLHEIGRFVGERSHHKHSMYLILNSELFGLSMRDKQIVALLARYHRKAMPSPRHAVYSALSHKNRIIVSKLAAILRVADAILRTRDHKLENIHCTFEPGQFIITVRHASDVSLEQIALTQKGDLFERVFGRKVVIRTGK